MLRCGVPNCWRRCRLPLILGMGRPLETAQRTAILAVALGRAAGLAPRDLKDAYHLAFLRFVGCTADAPLAAAILGATRSPRGAGWRRSTGARRPTSCACSRAT